MRVKIFLASAIGGIILLALGGVVIRDANTREKAHRTSCWTRLIARNISVPFEIERMNEPSPFAILSEGIDALVVVNGEPADVLDSFEKRLRSQGMPVNRTKVSVAYQSGDILIRLTHIAESTYRYEETFAI